MFVMQYAMLRNYSIYIGGCSMSWRNKRFIWLVSYNLRPPSLSEMISFEMRLYGSFLLCTKNFRKLQIIVSLDVKKPMQLKICIDIFIFGNKCFNIDYCFIYWVELLIVSNIRMCIFKLIVQVYRQSLCNVYYNILNSNECFFLILLDLIRS